METTTTRRKQHPPKKEKTRSITFRFQTRLIEELETEAMQKNVSLNVLTKQILEKYIQWDRFSDKIGIVPVPKKILDVLGKDMTGKDIDHIIDVILPMIKDTVLFMKGDYDLKRVIETLEDYMRASGMTSDHRLEGTIHHFIIQHDLGMNWSFFTEQLLKRVFHSFLPNTNFQCKTTDSTVVAKIGLGSDWSEHDY